MGVGLREQCEGGAEWVLYQLGSDRCCEGCVTGSGRVEWSLPMPRGEVEPFVGRRNAHAAPRRAREGPGEHGYV